MRFSLRKKKPEEKPRRDVVVHVPTIDGGKAETLPVTVTIENRVSETEDRLGKVDNYLQKTLVPLINNGFDKINDEFGTVAEARVEDRTVETNRFRIVIVITVIALIIAVIALFR